ncbi:hypothetical protein [Paenimyroides aestuarii]|uniref:Uncharacterized protein n=1 Tax=Paenimyroides aestuarii TaxID=2968490 RepID=A0ABY5NVN5_9FLAO|nr:hypothetical protein [Paenimyroides aestuarii]UUV22563.1 hypothetical protein NPX36_05850 [Paenimyroides aestuarii]
MKIILVILLSVFSFAKVFATAQYPDRIVFNNKEYSLLTNPLEKYFEKNEDKRPKGGVMSTALWRGYVATFEIIENQLYVKDIKIQIWNEKSDDTEWKSVINEVFPKTEDRKIDWFNGLLTLPYGELINYVHMGYGSTYENYIIIEIEKGKYIKSKDLNFKEYENLKEKQFEAYIKSNEYLERKKELKKDGWKQKDIDGFLRSFVTEYTEKLLIE